MKRELLQINEMDEEGHSDVAMSDQVGVLIDWHMSFTKIFSLLVHSNDL